LRFVMGFEPIDRMVNSFLHNFQIRMVEETFLCGRSMRLLIFFETYWRDNYLRQAVGHGGWIRPACINQRDDIKRPVT
ncbi:MAG: hypothetical protein ABIY56_03890, partial [Dokdonella sp.]